MYVYYTDDTVDCGGCAPLQCPTHHRMPLHDLVHKDNPLLSQKLLQLFITICKPTHWGVGAEWVKDAQQLAKLTSRTGKSN